MISYKGYKIRMYPTFAQERKLIAAAGARRFVYNWAVERRKTHYEKHGIGIERGVLSAELTQLKKNPGFAWLKEYHAGSLQQSLVDVYQAYRNFFDGFCGYPKFKSKKRDCTFRVPQKVKLTGSRIWVAKIGWIKIRSSRGVTGKVGMTTFRREPSGKWYASTTLEIEIPDKPIERVNIEQVRGVDVGIASLVTLDTGEKHHSPRSFRRIERKIRRAQKTLKRRVLGGKNREKARKRIAVLYERAKNIRLNHIQQTTTKIVNSSDGIAIETINIAGLVRTKLAKALLDVAMGDVHTKIVYKCKWSGKHLMKIDRWFPSTKTCHKCGGYERDIPLSVRRWTCQSCRTEHDRDVNAARNIRNEGLKMLVAAGYVETENACRDGIRLDDSLGQRATVSEAGTTHVFGVDANIFRVMHHGD